MNIHKERESKKKMGLIYRYSIINKKGEERLGLINNNEHEWNKLHKSQRTTKEK